MSDSPASNPGPSGATHEEMLSALFAQMVIQQTNMAMMLLGKVPHPQTGETIQDLDAARMFIDQLEMLQVKTRGNLNAHEEKLLKQSLLSAQMMFVEAVQSAGTTKSPEPTTTPSSSDVKPSTPASGPSSTQSTSSPGATSEAESESKKKFSKKY
jgi:hypothetical protein